jgi:hypothetical protein
MNQYKSDTSALVICLAIAATCITLLVASFLASELVGWFDSLTKAQLSFFRGACTLFSAIALAVAGMLRWRKLNSNNEP